MGMNKVSIPWSDVAKRLRGRLSSAHIRRLSVYLDFPKRVRQGTYLERVGLFLTAGLEDRLRLCFGILDADGDGAIGARDIFAAVGSTTYCHRSARACLVDAIF